MQAYVQYWLWHKTTKELKGPFDTINQPRWLKEVFDREGGEGWLGGTLEQILRTPGVDRTSIAKSLGVRRD